MVREKRKIVDWTEIVPTCKRLQAAGYRLEDVRLAWRAAERGGTDHLQVPASAYKAARDSQIDKIDVITWSDTGKAQHGRGKLVGLTKRVAYLDVDGRMLTFSLSHGRTVYGSQHRLKAKLGPESLASLIQTIQGVSELEQRLIDATAEPKSVGDLCDALSLPKATIYHAMRRLVRRKLVKRLRFGARITFQRTRQEDDQ